MIDNLESLLKIFWRVPGKTAVSESHFQSIETHGNVEHHESKAYLNRRDRIAKEMRKQFSVMFVDPPQMPNKVMLFEELFSGIFSIGYAPIYERPDRK